MLGEVMEEAIRDGQVRWSKRKDCDDGNESKRLGTTPDQFLTLCTGLLYRYNIPEISGYPKQNQRLLTGCRCRPPQGEAPSRPPYAVPNLTTYRRNAPLLLVHPILQHLLDFLSRRFILFFLFFCVFDRGPRFSILNGGTLLIVGRRCGRTGN